jgi:hypothetical protein
VECLGLRLTAFALGIRKTSEVKGMTTGEVTPTTLQAVNLEQLAEWVTILRKLESATIRALSIGMWPDLNDELLLSFSTPDRADAPWRCAQLLLNPV